MNGPSPLSAAETVRVVNTSCAYTVASPFTRPSQGAYRVKPLVVLRAASLLTLLLLTLHLADDIRRDTNGMNQGGLIAVVLTLVAWLFGILVLSERRVGHVVILAGALLAAFVPVTHLQSVVSGEFARTDGSLFVAWTLLALGVSAILTCVVAVHGLWGMRR